MQAHQEAIDRAVAEALRSACSALGTANPDDSAMEAFIRNHIAAIAVTRGPGLELCLRVGCVAAEVSQADDEHDENNDCDGDEGDVLHVVFYVMHRNWVDSTISQCWQCII